MIFYKVTIWKHELFLLSFIYEIQLLVNLLRLFSIMFILVPSESGKI